MELLNRNQVKDLIIEALKKVADLPANVEEAAFDQMVDFPRKVFIGTLKRLINSEPVIDGGDDVFYDIDLNLGDIDKWETVKDCIDFVFENLRITFK